MALLRLILLLVTAMRTTGSMPGRRGCAYATLFLRPSSFAQLSAFLTPQDVQKQGSPSWLQPGVLPHYLLLVCYRRKRLTVYVRRGVLPHTADFRALEYKASMIKAHHFYTICDAFCSCHILVRKHISCAARALGLGVWSESSQTSVWLQRRVSADEKILSAPWLIGRRQYRRSLTSSSSHARSRLPRSTTFYIHKQRSHSRETTT